MLGTIVRGLVILILGLATAGFGVCGVMGTISGLQGTWGVTREYPDFSQLTLACGAAGIIIAALCVFLIVKLVRKRPAGP